MIKTFGNLRFKLFSLGFLLIAFSCEKEDTDKIVTQEKFNSPGIEAVQQFFNQNSSFINTYGIQNKNTTGTLLVDWPSSNEKDYKDTPEQDVDILYTPIYLDTDRDAKAFIASTEQSGTIESKLIFVLYKATNNQNGLSAYVFVYNINGTLELEYNFEDGQSVPFAENSSGLQSKNITDCSQLPSLTPEELLSWLAQCTIALDEVTVVGYLNETINAGDSGGGGFDISPWVQIGGFEIPYEGGSGGSSGANPEVFISNIVSGTGFSISMALGLSLSSMQAQWLNQQTINNQALLNAIAQFLNANKDRPIDPAFNNVDPNQLPEIRDEAVSYVIDIINSGVDGTLITAFPYVKYPPNSNYTSLYPRLTEYLRNQLPTIKDNDLIINKLVQYGDLSAEVVKSHLEWGQGPIIEVVQLDNFCTNCDHNTNGLFNTLTPDRLYLDLDIVLDLENLEPNSNLADAFIFLVGMTILHEYVHFSEYTDETWNNPESGELFEQDVYSQSVYRVDGEIILINND